MPRLEFQSETKRLAYKRCECKRIPFLRRPNGCGIVLGAGNVFYEHIEPDAIKPDNSLENSAVLCRTCWRDLKAYIGQCCEIGESATWPELKDLRAQMRAAIAKAEGGNIR